MPDDSRASSPPDQVALRHERLRLSAPAVQHDINNAMMVLASNLELLGRSVAEGAPRRQLDRALEAVRRLEDTMRSFLDAARRPLGDQALISPALALKQVLPLLRVALGARSGIDATVAEGVWQVRLDRARLDLALLVLAQEASAVLPPGARLGVTLENRAAGAEVALTLALPEGTAPLAQAPALLEAALAATGGRVERQGATTVLLWPKG